MITSVEEQISKVPLYQRLTEQDRIELASVCHLESYERGSEVFAEGELADLLRTTVETAVRVMSRWGKSGIVSTEKEGFLVTDVEALERLSLN